MKNRSAFSVALVSALAFAACSSPRVAPQGAAANTKAARAALIPPKPNDPYFAQFDPKPAPQPTGLFLQKGDRLAICGDSITEQKMYSRVMETYLTVCAPELGVTVRQYGWGGEKADGFWRRMTNDCLGFKPTIATTCYGMNDHAYRPYQNWIGWTYRSNQLGVVRSFKDNGVRVVLGSAGCVGKRPWWGDTNATTDKLNQNLCTLRNIDIDIAEQENTAFADVFWPMLVAGREAQEKYSSNYAIAGGDGVHPGWAGSFVMAYAFLRAMGLDGEIGTYTVDLNSGKASASAGHEVVTAKKGEVEIKSSRYPFCATGDVKSDGSIRSAMSLIPFNQELNRLTLKVSNASAPNYKVTWGSTNRIYSAAQLAEGVNLAADFPVNPFSKAFEKVDAAVTAKQNYETHQIKDIFNGLEYKKEPELMRKITEEIRTPLADAIKTAFVPVTHQIRIEAE